MKYMKLQMTHLYYHITGSKILLKLHLLLCYRKIINHEIVRNSIVLLFFAKYPQYLFTIYICIDK